jgi:YVTN family beta-propeller protein
MHKVSRKLVLALVLLSAMTQLHAGITVYVPLGSANEILVIDGQTDKVSGRIGGVTNAHGLATTPAGEYLVAPSMWATPQGEPVVPPRPSGMSEDEHRAHHGAPANENKAGVSYISVIDINESLDISERQVIRSIKTGGVSHHSAVSADGQYAISTHPTIDAISVIDLIAGKLVRMLPTGPQPNYIAVTKDGQYIYVSNSGNNTISKIDTQQWTVSRNLAVGMSPEHLLLSPDERTLYVNNAGDGTVAAISLADGQTTRTFKVGEGPHGIDISDDGTTLFVSSKLENKLLSIDLVTGKIRIRTLGPMPYHVTTITGTGKLYVTSRAEPRIWVLDQNTLELRGEIPIRGEGHQMVVVRQ